jgi:hypothetical protein
VTKIHLTKRVKRETACTERLRPIVVELYPLYCGMRVKGKREFYPVPWDAVLALGRRIAAREKLARKLA